jgi:hypothetical protein
VPADGASPPGPIGDRDVSRSCAECDQSIRANTTLEPLEEGPRVTLLRALPLALSRDEKQPDGNALRDLAQSPSRQVVWNAARRV